MTDIEIIALLRSSPQKGLTAVSDRYSAYVYKIVYNKGFQSKAVKFETFCEEWFESYAKPNLRNTTYERILLLRTRVYGAIGHLRMDKINPRQIQAFVNTLSKEGANEKTGKPLSPKTVKHYLSMISEVFTYAEKMGVMTGNPCSKVTNPKGEYKEKEIYSPTEIQKILESGALGHSAVSTTSNIFCHMLDEARAKVTDAVSAALDFHSAPNNANAT